MTAHVTSDETTLEFATDYAYTKLDRSDLETLAAEMLTIDEWERDMGVPRPI